MSFDPLNDQNLAEDPTAAPSVPGAPAAPVMTASRIKRNLFEEAIEAARRADWSAAVETNERILEMGPDVSAENRLAKALWEQGELGKAREHYQAALAIDPTNRIAERNIGRLRMLMSEGGGKTMEPQEGSKAPVNIFVEETGKTGFAHLVDLASPSDLAPVNPGDLVELVPQGARLVAKANGVRIGVVEPRVAARLIKLVEDGNKYSAGVTSLGDKDVRLIIRETYQDPINYGKVSFPTAARVSDLRPYTKGTLVREEMELEEELELDEEPEAVDVNVAVPEETAPEEGFQVVDEDTSIDDDDVVDVSVEDDATAGDDAADED